MTKLDKGIYHGVLGTIGKFLILHSTKLASFSMWDLCIIHKADPHSKHVTFDRGAQ